MQSIEILDVKNFMQLLFQTDTLSNYLFVSATIQTDMLYTLDGHINKEFFREDELDTLSLSDSSYLPWSIAKEKVFLLIRGKKTPSQLKVVLRVNPEQMERFLAASDSSLRAHDIDGLFLNIMFQNGKLNVVCGISYKIFTMEKELENEFSDKITSLFKSNNITCN